MKSHTVSFGSMLNKLMVWCGKIGSEQVANKKSSITCEAQQMCYPFPNPSQDFLWKVLSHDRCILYPQEHVVVRCSVALVLLSSAPPRKYKRDEPVWIDSTADSDETQPYNDSYETQPCHSTHTQNTETDTKSILDNDATPPLPH